MTMLLRITVFVVLCICAAQCTEEDERTFGSYACLWNSRYRSFDGTCNNLLFPAVGAAGQLFRRGGEGVEYNSDGSPVSDRPIERVISNKVSRDDPALLDPIPHSMVATQFGQFVNHDMNLNAFDDPDTLVYPDVLHVPEKDDSFCMVQLTPTNFTKVNVCVPPYNQVPPYNRPPLFTTKFSLRTTVQRRPEVYNLATSWLDLSQVYGTSGSVATLLRTGTGGKLLTKDYTGVTTSPSRTFGFFQFGMGPTPPFSCLDCLPSWGQLNGQVRVPPLMDPTKVTNFVYDPHKIVVAGDERAGENGALSMFHTLFLRNHNRHATRIAQQQPNLSDEEIFQRARRRNIAEYQNIVMYDYVPAEFGDYFASKIGRYRGYNPFVDSDTNIAFATAAFRYGHSTFRNYVPINQCGAPTMFGMPAGNTKLMFGGTTGGPILPMDVYVSAGSWENLIRGLIASRTAPNDVMIDSNLRDLPFGFPFAGGTDIWVLDLHRARENGIPNYVALQKEYGKRNARIYGARGCPERYARNNQPDPQECFDALVPYNKTLAENLRALYVKVNRVDALMGLLAEVHVRGSSFGETLGTIMMDTYRRARDGDRFWFENRFQPFPFTEREIDDIKDVGLDDLFRNNFNFPSAAHVPGNPFISPSRYLTTLSHTQGCS